MKTSWYPVMKLVAALHRHRTSMKKSLPRVSPKVMSPSSAVLCRGGMIFKCSSPSPPRVSGHLARCRLPGRRRGLEADSQRSDLRDQALDSARSVRSKARSATPTARMSAASAIADGVERGFRHIADGATSAASAIARRARPSAIASMRASFGRGITAHSRGRG